MRQKDIENAITNALLELMKTEDYDKISITDIVNKAGLSRVTYYRHFNSKEDILIRFFDNAKSKFLEMNKVSGPDTNELVILNLFIYFKSNMEVNKCLVKANLDMEILKFLSNEFLEVLPQKVDKYFAYFVAGALFNVSIHWLENDCKDGIDQVTKPFIDLDKAFTSYREANK